MTPGRAACLGGIDDLAGMPVVVPEPALEGKDDIEHDLSRALRAGWPRSRRRRALPTLVEHCAQSRWRVRGFVLRIPSRRRLEFRRGDHAQRLARCARGAWS